MNFSTIQHKKMIASGVIALVVLAIGFYVSHSAQFGSIDKKLATQDITAVNDDAQDADQDKDGLPDWKEKLYGSDMYAIDSDKDGTNDGDEVRSGRNPAIANTAKTGKTPTDILKYLQDPNFATSSTDIQGIKKEYFAKYLAERSKDIRETSFRDLIRKEVNPTAFKPTHELLELKVTSDNSAESVRRYVNAFGVLINKYTVRTNRTEEEILDDAMTNKNPSALKELQYPAVTYRNFVKDLVSLEVPAVLAKAHLEIVNGYEGMEKGILGMQFMYSDPPQGAAGYQTYTKYRFDVTEGYANIVAYVGQHSLTFTKDEPGYPFYWNTVATDQKSKLK